jgi:hypothetical protein
MNSRLSSWSQLWDKHYIWIGVVASGGLVLVCYGFALGLPFFFDDLPIMTWLSHHGWVDIWTRSSENSYYRPLAFTVYKLGLLLPVGTRQVVLHAVSLLVHWMGALLIMRIVELCDHSSKRAVLAAILFAVFPFLFLAIPWVTALSHPLVTMLTLLAVYAALRAERDGAFLHIRSGRYAALRVRSGRSAARWWGISLLATALAPFAHESGPVCGFIVGGVVLVQYGIRGGLHSFERRRFIGVSLGILLNVVAVLLRSRIPGVGDIELVGLDDWFQNTMFFLHGLLYPVAPIIGRLVHRWGWHDFTLVGLTAALFALLLVWLARRSGDWRWVVRNLWWWAWGALPAAAALKYGDLFISPRLHALAAAGVTMLWAGVIIELGKLVRSMWRRRLVWGLLAGAIVAQNVAFLNHQRTLYTTLNHVHQQVLLAAEDRENEPLGYVNVPAWLAYRDRTYALVTEGVEFVPPYSNLSEFIQVNVGWRAADGVMFTPVLQETEQVFGFRGAGLSWEEMRQFAVDHRTVWLTTYQDGQFVLKHVGSIERDLPLGNKPLVRFEGGPVIETVAVQRAQEDDWAVALTWVASGPVDGEIFLHVRDANDDVVAQADGPALGGTVPIWIWQPGDRILDERYFSLPQDRGPYTVQVGIYNAQGRFPAFLDNVRAADGAATIATILP